MGTLRHVRAEASGSAFDGRFFFERDPRFSPIIDVASAFADHSEWPTTTEIDRALSARAGIRFVLAKKRPRRSRGPVALGDLYDAHIARGEVPTRERHWHDFLNALVWATFPRAKAALHKRQHGALQAWARTVPVLEGDRVAKLPNARTRELDALALVDEGSVLVMNDNTTLIFGHALYEGLVLGTPAMVARAIPLAGPASSADALLEIRITEPLAPEDLARKTL